MKRQTFTLLAVAVVLLLGLVIWLNNARQPELESTAQGILIPALESNLNEVSTIAITGPEESVTLQKVDAGWQVMERAGYPANMQELRRQLIALANAQVVEQKTANPDNHARLELAAPDAEEGAGVAVELQGLAEPQRFVFGKTDFRGGSFTYVRRDGEDQTWLASGNLRLNSSATDWLDKTLVDVPVKRVRRVTVTHGDGAELKLDKADPDQLDFDVADIPPERELQSPSAGNTVAGALSSLRLDDVKAGQRPTDVPPTVAVYETFDGLRLRAEAWAQDDARYLTLQAEYDPSLVWQSEEEDPLASGSEAEEVPPIENELNQTPAIDGQALAVEIQNRVEGWIYQIPSYKYDNLTKTLDALLKPLPEDSGADSP